MDFDYYRSECPWIRFSETYEGDCRATDESCTKDNCAPYYFVEALEENNDK